MLPLPSRQSTAALGSATVNVELTVIVAETGAVQRTATDAAVPGYSASWPEGQLSPLVPETADPLALSATNAPLVASSHPVSPPSTLEENVGSGAPAAR